MGMNLKDAELTVTKALPAGATNVTSDALDTGAVTSRADQPGEVELLLTAPTLAGTALTNGATVIFDIMQSTSSAMSGATTLASSVITLTGSGTNGATGTTWRGRLPTNASRYVAAKATKIGAESAAAASLTLEMVF